MFLVPWLVFCYTNNDVDTGITSSVKRSRAKKKLSEYVSINNFFSKLLLSAALGFFINPFLLRFL